MTPKLYVADASPPVRSVYLTEAALGINLEHIQVDLSTGQHLKPEYLKINPQHTIPTLVDDDDTVIWDSHAINAYLVSKYGKDDSLYPKDLVKRSVVDQRLHFDSGIVFPTVRGICEPLIFWGHKSIPSNLKENAIKVYDFLETFLDGRKWAAGDAVTIADFSLIANITSLNHLVPIDDTKFVNIKSWLNRAEQLPCYAAQKDGLEKFKTLLDSKLSQ